MGQVPGDSLHKTPRPADAAGGSVDGRADRRPADGSVTAAPWQIRPRDALTHGLPEALLSPLVGEEPLSGVERRLPRRAEVLWNRLRGDADLPPAEAAGALLAAPFSTQALLVTKPLKGPPQIAYAGGDISWLGPAAIGPANADSRPGATIPARLAALALSAVAAGKPLHLDSDFDPDTGGKRPAVLFRAVALPLAADPTSDLAGLAVAVLSWRKLLSQVETDALHGELQAAISWLGSTGPGKPGR